MYWSLFSQIRQRISCRSFFGKMLHAHTWQPLCSSQKVPNEKKTIFYIIFHINFFGCFRLFWLLLFLILRHIGIKIGDYTNTMRAYWQHRFSFFCSSSCIFSHLFIYLFGVKLFFFYSFLFCWPINGTHTCPWQRNIHEYL